MTRGGGAEPSRAGPLFCIAAGIAGLGAPLLGVAGTVWGMIRAFQTLGADGDAAAPGELAEAIGMSLYSTLAGAALFVVGVALTVIGLIWLSRRNRLARAAGG